MTRKSIPITPQMDKLITAFAKQHYITQAEAIRRLIGMALGQDWANAVVWGGDRFSTKDEPDNKPD